ncbi:MULTISPECIES: fluoride efflux transporter CrcB [unclassified Oceanobacter]|uniref:fluoride efflux transporter CrcB n=1 Tax=unclassified Oceanobacter TaxID=2620260 RepID=UPI0026E29508|nr:MULTISPECIES: fluoride efflux transporter CrcB [unclassified Oceanobacter]MDO6681084.1 fluoride efflux transporter CrcB [Oceanobacter sp. 5_MG-2023]MDP2504344.1 fluoride efflux transporter CrcB [Oceanobacter sp. 3_MG-2023]MDP2546782.1 fluoride efflux transporter CrcB [Oceanobacter sp. 4_MG-2023]MDP2608735.1 fluoride efflux transporter CrcB [Oceanobacter sp. 1_MG-2023]MDP2611831.1 fluoride efflux transporter CrcB [Oceanobacter sp. 2_MG-2023]
MALLWIGLGGAFGALFRYWVASSVFRWMGKAFPYGTLSVNLIGSFVIGMAFVFLVQQQWGAEHHKQLAMVGFLGAFTTFSTFSLESVSLLQQQRYSAAAAYIGISVIGCLLATGSGMALASTLLKNQG